MSVSVNVVEKQQQIGFLSGWPDEEKDYDAFLHGQPFCSWKEPLGTYISDYDTKQILSSGIRKRNWIRAYHTDQRRNREKYILDFLDIVISTVDSYFNSNIIDECAQLFKHYLPKFLERFEENYFTSNYIAMYFLALLDYRLSLVGGKISPKHLEPFYDLPKITSGVFSFINMKKIQAELYTAGIIKRQRRRDFYLPLRTKINDFINLVLSSFPELEEKMRRIEKIVYKLISDRIIPGTNYDEAAITMVMAVSQYFFTLKYRKDLWDFIEDCYGQQKEKILRATYRFRARLKEKGFEQEISIQLKRTKVKPNELNKEEQFKKLTEAFNLKKKIFFIIDKLMHQFPKHANIFLVIEKKAYEIIDKEFYPKIDKDKVPSVIILSLFRYYDLTFNELQNIWDFVSQLCKHPLYLLRQRVYHLRYKLRKEGLEKELYPKWR
ncbi:MAG: hypothetical protein ACTSQE_11560 [Candidatus Heimdallarchaeaceae archaeon]